MPSAVIRRYAWRPAERALDIEFVTGRVYRYHDLPEDVAQDMRRWMSKGAYFNRYIRDRYRYERLPGWPPDEAAAVVIR